MLLLCLYKFFGCCYSFVFTWNGWLFDGWETVLWVLCVVIFSGSSNHLSVFVQNSKCLLNNRGREERRGSTTCTTSLRWDEIPLLINWMSVYTCKLLVGMSGERMVIICHLSNIKFAFSLYDIMFGEFEREWRMYHFLSSVYCHLNVCWILWIQFLQYKSIYMSKSINRLLFNVNDVMMTMWIGVFFIHTDIQSYADRTEVRWWGWLKWICCWSFDQ